MFSEPAGCEGVSFLPYLAGERSPNWPHASGAIVGLRPGHLGRPGLLYRAALEGVAFSLRAGLRELGTHGRQHQRGSGNGKAEGGSKEASSGSGGSGGGGGGGGDLDEPASPLEVRLVGGGSKNALWRRIIADALQCRVALPAQPESAALGAALQAAAAVAIQQEQQQEETEGDSGSSEAADGSSSCGGSGGSGGSGGGGVVDIGKWIQQHHDPPLSGEPIDPDPAAAAAYEEAFRLYEERAADLFAGRRTSSED